MTTVIYCLEVSLLLIFVNCNVFKIVLLELLPSLYSHIIPVRKTLHWLPIEHCSLRLPYWCTSSHIVVSRHILYLSLNLDIVSITHIKVKLMLYCLKSGTLLFQYINHFGLSFSYDAPKIWNDLPDDVHSASFHHSIRKKLKTYLFAKAYPP